MNPCTSRHGVDVRADVAAGPDLENFVRPGDSERRAGLQEIEACLVRVYFFLEIHRIKIKVAFYTVNFQMNLSRPRCVGAGALEVIKPKISFYNWGQLGPLCLMSEVWRTIRYYCYMVIS